MSELLPCPFCGSEGYSPTLLASKLFGMPYPQDGDLSVAYDSYGWAYVQCANCNAQGVKVKAPRTERDNDKMRKAFTEAIEAWNTRATNQPNSLPDVSENHQEDENDTLKVNIHNLDELEEAYADALTYFYGKKYVPERTCRNVSNVDGNFVCSECEAWIEALILWNDQYPGGESSYVKDCKLNYCPNCGAEVV